MPLRPSLSFQVLFSALILAPWVSGQDLQREITPGPESATTSSADSLQLRGEDVPQYLVIQNFFTVAANVRDAGNATWRGYLSTLGIRHGSKEEGHLHAAIDAALVIRDRASGVGTSTLEAQRQAQLVKARQLGQIWRRLLRRLEGVKGSEDALRREIEEIRRSTTFVVTGESLPGLAADLAELEEAFGEDRP